MRARATLIAAVAALTTAVSCAAPPPGTATSGLPTPSTTTTPSTPSTTEAPGPTEETGGGPGVPVAIASPGPDETVPLGWDGAAADETDVPYGPDPAHVGDVYLPSDGGNRGVIVVVHGGAFVEGDRSHAVEWYGPVMAQTRRGFAVFNITYRLTDGEHAVFPAGVADVTTAVGWVRAHGAEHGLNAETVVVAGHSAGGTLATLVGLGGNGDPDGPLGTTAAVDGWLSMSGVYDFAEASEPVVGLGRLWLGANGTDPTWIDAASATSHLDREDPPGLIVHGDRDGIIPVGQALHLIATATQLGVTTGLHYDIVGAVDECRGHLPQCGLNAAALDRWVDAVAARLL